jgi:hypothetical protein
MPLHLNGASFPNHLTGISATGADSDEAGQVFRFEAGHCTEVMSARLRRSPRVGGIMGSALWSGQERAVADSGGNFMLPFGHPFVRPDGHPFVPTCAMKGAARRGGQGWPQATAAAARSVLDGPEHAAGLARVGTSICHDGATQPRCLRMLSPESSMR